MEDFLNYDQALALEELGFDEPCIATVDQVDYVHIKGTKKSPRGSMIYNIINCPLYRHAFRWIRKKYKINFNIEPAYYGSTQSMFSIEQSDPKNPYINSDYYDSYEEAEVYCLDKLIEICKKIKNYDSKNI